MRLNLKKLDSNQNLFFARSLESIDQKNYETLFAGLLGRRYVPLIEGIPEWASVYTYRMYEMTGEAKIIGPGVNDLPRVGVKAVEASRVIKEIGVSYGWSVREIQQASATNTPLDEMTVMSARTSVARQMDDLIAVGSDLHAITGLLNIPGVLETTPSTKTGTGAGTAWIRTVPVSPDEIVADINLFVSQTRSALKQADSNGVPQFARFVILLPTTRYAYIATTPRSSNSDMTILQYVLQNNPWIESIEEWWQCDTADGGTNPRAVIFPRDPMCGGAVVPKEFSTLAPQEEGLMIVVPATATCGGYVCRYPVAVRYMDTI